MKYFLGVQCSWEEASLCEIPGHLHLSGPMAGCRVCSVTWAGYSGVCLLVVGLVMLIVLVHVHPGYRHLLPLAENIPMPTNFLGRLTRFWFSDDNSDDNSDVNRLNRVGQ